MRRKRQPEPGAVDLREAHAGTTIKRLELTLNAEDRVRVRAELADLLVDWRDLLAQHVTQSRKILRKVLTKRVRFIAETRGDVAGYRVEVEGTLQPLVSGVVQGMASLTGLAALWYADLAGRINRWA